MNKPQTHYDETNALYTVGIESPYKFYPILITKQKTEAEKMSLIIRNVINNDALQEEN